MREPPPQSFYTLFDYISYLDKFYLFNSAFERSFSQYNPGLYLFNHLISEAILRNKKEIDFLRREERYKYELGAKGRKLYKIILQGDEK